MTAPSTTRVAALVLAASLAGWAAGEARRLPADMPAAYPQECGSCHTAFPPGLLPRDAWARVMAGLERHYGSDASLDAALARQIEAWLLAHAGSSRKVNPAPPEDRLTRAAWFERKHRRVEPATWRLPSVKSAANCAACHTGADRGDYDDDRLRLPEGASRAQRRAWSD
jgi:mono/diheme cytochrome c family protein